MHHGSHVYVLGALCLVFGWMVFHPRASGVDQKGEWSPQNKNQTQFELRVIRTGDTAQGIRFKPTTGKAWYIAGDRWVLISETGEVPAGDFDVVIAPLERNFRAFRFDRLTGATWQVTDRKWVKLREPE